jgi:hypothetical protein
MVKKFTSLSFLMLVTHVTVPIHAQPAETRAASSPAKPAESVEPPPLTWLFARIGLGTGWMHIDGERTFAGVTQEFQLSGTPLVAELEVGGQIVSGFSLGALAFAATAPTPTFTTETDFAKLHSSPHNLTLWVIGPFADVYIDPPSGLHLTAFGGFAILHWSDRAGDAQHHSGSDGFGLGFGAGYDWPISKQFNLGFTAQIVYANVSADKVANMRALTNPGDVWADERDRVYVPSILINVTHR